MTEVPKGWKLQEGLLVPEIIRDSFTESPLKRRNETLYPPLNQIPALILAGGYQSRMKTDTPKSLILVTPTLSILDLWIQTLTQAGVTDITISCLPNTIDQFRKSASTVKFSVLDDPRDLSPGWNNQFKNTA